MKDEGEYKMSKYLAFNFCGVQKDMQLMHGFNPTKLHFPIFLVKLSHFVTYENISVTMQQTSLVSKIIKYTHF